MNDKIIHVYTDGGIRPDSSMPQGSGYGGTGCGKCSRCINELSQI